MPEPTTLVAYIAVVFGLFLIPGPAVLLILGRSIANGRRTGIATGLGVATGDLIHTLMATIGLSAILMTSAFAFAIVKYAGVAYLCFLGILALVEKAQPLTAPKRGNASPASAFRQAILTEVLNPKTALFFLSFLPQFVTPERGPIWVQLSTLGGIFVMMSAIYACMVAIAAGSLQRWLANNAPIARWQGKVVGSIYLGLGAKLALEER